MLNQNVNNLLYFEKLSMKELYDCLKSWQHNNGKIFLNLSIQKDGDYFCCLAVVNALEVQEIEESMLLLTMEDIKDLVLWFSTANRWFSKGKGCAVDWEKKHLREEIALPIRQKLKDAKSEQDIMDSFPLMYVKQDSLDQFFLYIKNSLDY